MSLQNLFTSRTIKSIVACVSAVVVCSSANANVLYRWIGSDTNQSYGKDIQIEITLSNQQSYGGDVPVCNTGGAMYCPAQPTSSLIELKFWGAGGFDIAPRNGQPAYTSWNIDIAGGLTLLGGIEVHTFNTDLLMSSSGNLWTITEFHNDQNTPIADGTITGTFQQVPEPATLALFGITLAALLGFRRRNSARLILLNL